MLRKPVQINDKRFHGSDSVRNPRFPRWFTTCALLAFVVAATLVGPALAQVEIPVPPAQQIATETLEDAWRIALRSDQRIEAGQWQVASAQSTWAAARAERMPSLTLGADYYALSERPELLVTPPGLPSFQQSFINGNSAGAHGIVSQPLYTSGRISSGIAAAQSQVAANRSDLGRTVLDVKINVAESYVAVLSATKFLQVAQSKVSSLTAHLRDVGSLYEKGLVSKNDLLAAQVALADAQEKALDTANKLDVARAAYNRALGRILTEYVQLAELQDDGIRSDANALTSQAMQQRPELAALAAQARALQQEAEGERGKTGPQVAVQGGYLYQQNDYLQPNGLAGAMVGVEWNVLDMGRARNRANALGDKSEAVIRLRRDTQSMIALEVRQRWLELETARQRVVVARQATTQADENLRVARDRYQHQVGTNTEVLDAETLRIQAYTNLYDSTYQAVLAGLRLRRAVGTL
ncbi:MAG: TolC family protein [Thermoguttaceae bacterium]